MTCHLVNKAVMKKNCVEAFVIIFNALVLHSQGLKISKCNMYVRNGYDGVSETERVGKALTL